MISARSIAFVLIPLLFAACSKGGAPSGAPLVGVPEQVTPPTVSSTPVQPVGTTEPTAAPAEAELGTSQPQIAQPPPASITGSSAPATATVPPSSSGGTASAGTCGSDCSLQTFLAQQGNVGTSVGQRPDAHGAAGPSHIVSLANGGLFLVQDKTGNTILSRSQDDFWNSGLGRSGTEYLDSRIYFDELSQRWIAVTMPFEIPKRHLGFAVSASSDPTGTWYFKEYSTGLMNVDYPMLGFNKDWIASTGTASLFVFNKREVLDNNWPATPIMISAAFPGRPVTTYDPDEPNLYLVDSIDYTGQPPQLVLSKLSGPVDAPSRSYVTTVSGSGRLTVSSRLDSRSEPNYGAPQKGTSALINTLDSSVNTTAVLRNGHLWVCLRSVMPLTGPVERSSVAWYDVNVSTTPATLVQEGQVDTPSISYSYPSIAVNATNDVALGFSGSGPDAYVGVYFTFRKNTDPTGTMRTPVQYKEGEGPFGFGSRMGWGDYSATVADPSIPLLFWTIQQYAGSSRWGMQWGKFTIP